MPCIRSILCLLIQKFEDRGLLFCTCGIPLFCHRNAFKCIINPQLVCDCLRLICNRSVLIVPDVTGDIRIACYIHVILCTVNNSRVRTRKATQQRCIACMNLHCPVNNRILLIHSLAVCTRRFFNLNTRQIGQCLCPAIRIGFRLAVLCTDGEGISRFIVITACHLNIFPSGICFAALFLQLERKLRRTGIVIVVQIIFPLLSHCQLSLAAQCIADDSLDIFLTLLRRFILTCIRTG